jgi:hypothetical protein
MPEPCPSPREAAESKHNDSLERRNGMAKGQVKTNKSNKPKLSTKEKKEKKKEKAAKK